MELVVIFGVALLIFGPQSLPKMGRAIGKGIKDFKDAAAGLVDDDPYQRKGPPGREPPADAPTQNNDAAGNNDAAEQDKE